MILQPGEEVPFIEEIILKLPSIICDLTSQQVHAVYESLAHILSAQSNPNAFATLLESLMYLPNHSWETIISSIKVSEAHLDDIETLKSLSNILKTNNSVCIHLGGGFIEPTEFLVPRHVLAVSKCEQEDVICHSCERCCIPQDPACSFHAGGQKGHFAFDSKLRQFPRRPFTYSPTNIPRICLK